MNKAENAQQLLMRPARFFHPGLEQTGSWGRPAANTRARSQGTREEVCGREQC